MRRSWKEFHADVIKNNAIVMFTILSAFSYSRVGIPLENAGDKTENENVNIM